MTREEMFDVIKLNIRMIIDDVDQELAETDSMRDLGADSIEIVEVVSRSMKQLRIRVPRTELMEAENLKDLLDLFEKAAAKVTAQQPA